MQRTVKLKLVQLTLLFMMTPACTDVVTSEGLPEQESPGALTKTVWRWSALKGPESLEVTRPGNYTLELADGGTYHFRADCNTGQGSYSISGDRLNLGPAAMTLAACGPDSLGDRFAALLGSVVAFSRKDNRLDLELGDGAGVMELLAQKAMHLAGTSWLVHSYNNGKQAVVTVLAETTLYVDFASNGILSGSSGCNNLSGEYAVDGQQLEIGRLAHTEKLCLAEEVMDQETAFLAALPNAAKWEIRAERLQLRRADGALAVDLVSAVTGTVTYRTRQALLPDSQIRVSLLDVSWADRPATVIAEQAIPANGKQVPFPFRITFDPADIDPELPYAVRAEIRRQGKRLFTSTQAYPVITRDSPRYGIEIRVDPVGS